MEVKVKEVLEDGSALLDVEGMTDEDKEFFVQQGIIYTMMKQALKISDDDEFFISAAKGANISIDISE